MSKIKNGGLDHCGAKPFEQQRFTAPGAEGVKHVNCFIGYTSLLTIVLHLSVMRRFLR